MGTSMQVLPGDPRLAGRGLSHVPWHSDISPRRPLSTSWEVFAEQLMLPCWILHISGRQTANNAPASARGPGASLQAWVAQPWDADSFYVGLTSRSSQLAPQECPCRKAEVKGAAQDAGLWLLPCPGVSARWRHSQAHTNDLPQLEDTPWSHQGCVKDVTVSKMFLIALTENHSNAFPQETASNRERARAVLWGSHHPTSSSSWRIQLPLWIFPDLNSAVLGAKQLIQKSCLAAQNERLDYFCVLKMARALCQPTAGCSVVFPRTSCSQRDLATESFMHFWEKLRTRSEFGLGSASDFLPALA